jgi:hypothetical protein
MTEMIVMHYDEEEPIKTDKNNKKETWESPLPRLVSINIPVLNSSDDGILTYDYYFLYFVRRLIFYTTFWELNEVRGEGYLLR